MADMPETAFDRALLSKLKARDVALAAASANRILIDFLIKAGISRAEIEDAFRAKAQELIVEKFENNPANLLRMMAGVAGPRQPDE